MILLVYVYKCILYIASHGGAAAGRWDLRLIGRGFSYVLRLDLDTASEVLETTSLLSEFQTVGAVQQKARSAK